MLRKHVYVTADYHINFIFLSCGRALKVRIFALCVLSNLKVVFPI